VPDIPTAFGAAVRRLRLKKGLSQEELADRAKIDRTYASGIERARRNPSLKAIGRIADALEVSLTQLFREVERHL
jgi:XRE family transcriptional regulator, regulator of sulfur utilization